MNRLLFFILVALLPLISCRSNRSETKIHNQRTAVLLQSEQQVPKEKKNQAAYKQEQEEMSLRRFAVGTAADMATSKRGNRKDNYYAIACKTAAFIPQNTEEYDTISENGFHEAIKSPLSTFSIDVDAASYANVRRFINSSQFPPQDAVRIEELINYFPYSYQTPRNSDPVSINAEVAGCPWAKDHRLVRIGLKGREIETKGLPPSNLVFLIDVSGSMTDANKLPLLKSAFRLLINQLREKDKVSIVVYAGNAGLVLPATPGNHREIITEAIDRLEAGGSTAGGAGIQLAYDTAKRNFLKNGNNRVILATDGDFNVGVSSDGELVKLIEERRKEGVFLTVIGFGMGNYKDSKMEKLADKGNGNYAYIDNLLEANKVFVKEMGATLHTIAKDVKIQVEFNPARVKSYRLVGYENRLLKDEDFNNDKKDAGEMGAGSTVTALYEIVPVGVQSGTFSIDPLKYQRAVATTHTNDSEELLTVKFRYKEPKGSTSKMVSLALLDQGKELSEASEDLRFASAVAGFGMLLRDSEFKNELTYDRVIDLAKHSIGEDPEGYRAEFLKMAKTCQVMVAANQAVR